MNKRILILSAIILVAGGIIAISLLLTGPRMQTQASLRAFEPGMRQPPDKSVDFRQHTLHPEKISLPKSSPANLKKGKTYYNYYCVSCHGENGKGNGPVGQSYHPKPTNLTAGSLKTYNDTQLYIKSFRGTGHAPVMERVVPEEYRKYILTYVKSEY